MKTRLHEKLAQAIIFVGGALLLLGAFYMFTLGIFSFGV